MTASLPSPSPSGARATHASGSILRAWIEVAGRALTENVDQINDLNVFPVPDADTGTNSNATFQAAIRAVAELPADADALTVARSMGRAAALGARGNSGVILSQMLRGVSEAAIDPERPFTAV
ncbi:MAG: DAK2 domain-containing protein, partial [Actinobacteria bacterium]|nr:DAK2 domain-containing protein [Actinomycetota bacterium]